MPDQADQLRQLASALPLSVQSAAAGPPIVAVTGGRVGVGATTVAMNLGAALADAGMRVMLVDAALANANLSQMAGLPRLGDVNLLSELLAGNCTVKSALQPGPAGTLLLADRAAVKTPDDSRRAVQRLLSELQTVASGVDAIVVDAGNGVTAWTRRLWQRARLVLVVTTSEDSAIRDSYATIKLAAGDDAALCLLVNQCAAGREADSTNERLAGACRRFLSREVRGLPYIPLHEAESAVSRKPPRIWDAPNTAFGHAMLWLGRAIADILAAERAPAAVAALAQ